MIANIMKLEPEELLWNTNRMYMIYYISPMLLMSLIYLEGHSTVANLAESNISENISRISLDARQLNTFLDLFYPHIYSVAFCQLFIKDMMMMTIPWKQCMVPVSIVNWRLIKFT